MVYNSIFNTKPSKNNKQAFCLRVCELLDSIEFYENGYYYKDGKRMLNVMFRYNKCNMGYSSIDDLLQEANDEFVFIFKLKDQYDINDEEILVNIDIIANCLCGFSPMSDIYFGYEKQANDIIMLLMESMNQFLLALGYKFVFDGKECKMLIMQNEISIDLSSIDDKVLRDEIINYYDYRNYDNLKEKKKILLSLIGELESKKKDIADILGNNIADMFSNYANNFNLRHDNTNPNYKKYYNKTIADLNTDQLAKWYDYIFAFMINIFVSLENLKSVNINKGYIDIVEQ